MQCSRGRIVDMIPDEQQHEDGNDMTSGRKQEAGSREQEVGSRQQEVGSMTREAVAGRSAMIDRKGGMECTMGQESRNRREMNIVNQ
jgi:hypothetical protein